MYFFVFVVVVNEGNSEYFVQNSRKPWKGFNRGKIKNKICLLPLSFYDHLVAEMPTSQDLKFTNFVNLIEARDGTIKVPRDFSNVDRSLPWWGKQKSEFAVALIIAGNHHIYGSKKLHG